MSGRALVFGAANPLALALTMVLAMALTACGEKPQSMDVAALKADAQPWAKSDAANPAFYASGWKVGDKTSWENHMRQRNQAQNDYAPR